MLEGRGEGFAGVGRGEVEAMAFGRKELEQVLVRIAKDAGSASEGRGLRC